MNQPHTSALIEASSAAISSSSASNSADSAPSANPKTAPKYAFNKILCLGNCGASISKKKKNHRCNACMIIYNQQHPPKPKQPLPTINKKRKEHPSQPKSESPSKKLKPYDELHKTQRSVRRKTAINLLQQLSMPISELQPTIPPQEVIHLPTSIRQQMRRMYGRCFSILSLILHLDL